MKVGSCDHLLKKQACCYSLSNRNDLRISWATCSAVSFRVVFRGAENRLSLIIDIEPIEIEGGFH